MNDFKKETYNRIINNQKNDELKKVSSEFIKQSILAKYSYNFSWLGRPIIQYPQDIIALQEIIWKVKPDLIIETGIAHGGSLIFSATMLALLDLGDVTTKKIGKKSHNSRRKVLGIDIDIRPHNKKAIKEHPFSKNIKLLEGSSIENNIIEQVKEYSSNFKKILVILDSNHEHDHVLTELKIYSKLVSVKSYCIVFDTVIEQLPEHFFLDRNWKPGNNPKTAVLEFLKDNKNFKIDNEIQSKLLITAAPDGYLQKINEKK